MTCLILRLAGPMQSWGTQSRFTVRDTGLEPSKSGVIGLLCAALGRERDADVADLAAMRMGVRADHEGVLSRDYHTAGGGAFRGKPYGVVKASGAAGDPVVSERYYLADAEFHVALEGDQSLLQALHKALQSPRWPLYLGRRALPPDPPVTLGLWEGAVGEVLSQIPWRRRQTDKEDRLRLVIEGAQGDGATRMDVPLSFVSNDRRFTIRYVVTRYLPIDAVENQSQEKTLCT